MQFENNPSPYLTMVEQASPPDAPTTGRQRLSLDEADHKLKRIDENGAIVDLESMQDVVTVVPTSIPNGKVVLYDDGATVHAYFGIGGSVKGPFPLFSYDS